MYFMWNIMFPLKAAIIVVYIPALSMCSSSVCSVCFIHYCRTLHTNFSERLSSASVSHPPRFKLHTNTDLVCVCLPALAGWLRLVWLVGLRQNIVANTEPDVCNIRQRTQVNYCSAHHFRLGYNYVYVTACFF